MRAQDALDHHRDLWYSQDMWSKFGSCSISNRTGGLNYGVLLYHVNYGLLVTWIYQHHNLLSQQILQLISKMGLFRNQFLFIEIITTFKCSVYTSWPARDGLSVPSITYHLKGLRLLSRPMTNRYTKLWLLSSALHLTPEVCSYLSILALFLSEPE